VNSPATNIAAPTIQLFVNPRAGSASKRRIAALRRELEAAGARVIETPSSEGALAVAEDTTHVCAVGGDGTLRYVTAAVARAGRPIPMSIFPSGTVNLLAREYGYGREPAAFARRILGSGKARLGRYAHLGDTMMFTCASVGPDSAAVAALDPGLKRIIGRLAYGVAFLRVLIEWPRPGLRLQANGETIDCEAVYIAKGLYYAGPWSFAPHAAADDPFLHVVALRRARRRDFARFMWALLLHRRDLSGDPNLVRFSCDALRIEADGAPPLQADGDIVATLPVDLKIAAETQSFV
jgi:diacylglycerol kinase family enzyme